MFDILRIKIALGDKRGAERVTIAAADLRELVEAYEENEELGNEIDRVADERDEALSKLDYLEAEFAAFKELVV